jgi:hypothetical protein
VKASECLAASSPSNRTRRDIGLLLAYRAMLSFTLFEGLLL